MDVPFIGGFFTNTRGQQYGPFVRKKKLKKATGSGIVKSTDPMAKAPRGARGKQVIRKRTGFPKRQPVKRRSAKRKAPKARRGSFKKAKKPLRLDTKSVKRHYDDYGTLTRNHSLYMGFEAHGSKDRMWDILGEAVVKAVLAKMKIYPRAYDEPIGITPYDKIELTFKRVLVPTGADELTNATALTISAASTLKSISTDMANTMSFFADATNNATYEAYYLDFIRVQNQAAGAAQQNLIIKDIGECMVSFKSSQLIKLQNLTPNDAGTSDLDVVGTNPVSGMKYEFKNHRAKLVSEVQVLSASYDKLQENTATGFLPGFQLANADDRLVHPPKARQLFTNCSGSTPIVMGPGAFKSERTSFVMKHKLSTFIERIYYGGFDKGSWGGVTWFGLERTHRTVGSTALELNPVKIGFNRELMMSASIVLKTQKSLLKHYDNTSLGAVGP